MGKDKYAHVGRVYGLFFDQNGNSTGYLRQKVGKKKKKEKRKEKKRKKEKKKKEKHTPLILIIELFISFIDPSSKTENW